jgi:hypothetical protein
MAGLGMGVLGGMVLEDCASILGSAANRTWICFGLPGVLRT